MARRRSGQDHPTVRIHGFRTVEPLRADYGQVDLRSAAARQPATWFDELVLVPAAQMAYGTAWSMVIVRGPNPEERWNTMLLWLVLSVDKMTSAVASF